MGTRGGTPGHHPGSDTVPRHIQKKSSLQRTNRGGPGSIPGHAGFVADKVALGQVFSVYFGFPCQFSFHQMLNTHLSSGAGAVGQTVADVPSGLAPPPRNLKKM
jgi:hypothetical protein